MIAIPAVDLRGGACAQRLATGNAGESSSNPVEVARQWTRVGFRRLHVLDLDAISGANDTLVEEVLRGAPCEVQIAGAVDSGDTIQRLLDAGASHVVLGDRALDDHAWLEGVASSYPGQLIVATDVRERRVNTRGWVRTLPVDVLDVVEDLNGLSLAGILVLARHRQGAMHGTDLNLMEDVADAATVPVFAAGGVTTMDDLRGLEHRGLAGAIIGMALYSGALDARAVVSEFVEY